MKISLKFRVFLMLVLLFLVPLAVAEEVSFEEAVSALQKRDDNLALKLLDDLETGGTPSFGLYYNRGLAERNLGHYARARASFEKALLYNPRDLETRRRLREVKEKLGPQLPELDVTGTPPWAATEAEVALGLLTLALLLSGVRTLLGRRFPVTQTSLLTLALIASLVVVSVNNPPNRRAVLISERAKLLSAPKNSAPGAATINGVLFEVLERKSHFIKVKNRKGDTGWLREAELIEL